MRCTLCCVTQFSSSVAGEKHAQNKPRREKHAQNLQALSPIEVSIGVGPCTQVSSLASPHPSRHLSPHVACAAQVVRPRLLKWLVAFCMLEYVGAVAPSTTPVVDILKMESAPEMAISSGTAPKPSPKDCTALNTTTRRRAGRRTGRR